MVQWQTWTVLVLLLAAPVAFAGCTEDPDPVPADVPDEQGDENAEGTVDAPLDADNAVFAPVWRIGDGWTYAVSGPWAGESFTATYGPVEDAGDHWVMATDADAAFVIGYLNDGENIFLDGVSKDQMGLRQYDAFQDLVGFKTQVGGTWEASLFDAKFQMTKTAVESGEIMVEGTADGRVLEVVYGDAERNLKTLAIADGSGNDLLRFELQGITESASGLFRWEETDGIRLSADFGFETATAKTWGSDGSGELLYMTAHASSSSMPAVARVTDPEGQERLLFTSTADQASGVTETWEDQEGTWVLTGTSAGPQVVVTIRQIQVSTF